MEQEILKWYDEELDFYFLLRVHTSDGSFYAYNYRTLVRDEQCAKQFETARSAKRCAKQGGFSDYEILKIPRLREEQE